MILFKNGFFRLDYSPATDILEVNLPDMRTVGLSEAEKCFEIMIEHVRDYNIHRLLLDSSKAVVEVGHTEYNRLIYRVSMDLMKTNLKKVARIISSLQDLEEMAMKVQADVLKKTSSYSIKNFSDKEAASQWLLM